MECYSDKTWSVHMHNHTLMLGFLARTYFVVFHLGNTITIRTMQDYAFKSVNIITQWTPGSMVELLHSTQPLYGKYHVLFPMRHVRHKNWTASVCHFK